MHRAPEADPSTNCALVPLAITLRRTSEELRRLGAIATELDGFLGQVDLVALDLSHSGLELLQKVDLLAQSIAGLADFTEVLASLTPSDVAVAVSTAMQVLTVEALVNALGDTANRGDRTLARAPEHPILF